MSQRSLLPDLVPHGVRPSGRVIKNESVVARLGRAFSGSSVIRTDTEPDAQPSAVMRAGGCEQPIQLSGTAKSRSVDTTTGELSTRSFDLHAYAACKTRRASRCEPCSTLYRHDARHLVVAGLNGGKGITKDVTLLPAHFVTFTAPGFGIVHTANGGQCHPRRDAKVCAHGKTIVCWERHEKTDTIVGQPICFDCYDYDKAVLWNNAAPALWRVTRINIDRALCDILGVKLSTKAKDRPFRTQYVKVAEFQARGMVHFHVSIRLDLDDGVYADEHEISSRAKRLHNAKSQSTVEDLIGEGQTESALLALVVAEAHRSSAPAADERQITWGTQLDIRPITPDDPADDKPEADEQEGPNVSRRRVSNYLSKYATKGSDLEDKLDRRFRDEKELRFLPVNDHLARMVRTSWRLARTHEGDRLDAWAHQLGYRGHFLTKSRGWSTTFKALRQVRKDHQEALRKASWEALNPNVVEEIETKWSFTGSGYRVGIDDAIGEAIRTRKQEQRRHNREKAA